MPLRLTRELPHEASGPGGSEVRRHSCCHRAAISLPGDANRDGVFDQLEFALVLQFAKFITGRPTTCARVIETTTASLTKLTL